MCGIIGYIGKKDSVNILMEGLKRMEYRGYDSAGLSVICADGLMKTVKRKGNIAALESSVSDINCKSNIGIAHTRWATHGEPNDINAHPHNDCSGRISLVHNGIVENFKSLKNYLQSKGHKFVSDTDTEVIAHMIEEFIDNNDILTAVRKSMKKIIGTYGLLVISSDNPDRIIAARMGSPMVIGKSRDQMIIASDASAIIAHTNQVMYLEDGEIAEIFANDMNIMNLYSNNISDPKFTEIDMTLEQIEKGGYEHFMLKEIYEQPEAIRNTLRGRLDKENGTIRLNGIKNYIEQLTYAERIVITACGTSWHAALIGKYLIEYFTDIPVEVDYASEFRYRNPIVNKKTVVIAISQSGETADTIAAINEAKRKGSVVLGICNVIGSTISRITDAGVYMHAGPEVGVASTKAFTSQVTVLLLIAVLLGRKHHMSFDEGMNIINNIDKLPEKIEEILKSRNYIKKLSKRLYKHTNFLYLGRGFNYPAALEGALKLKEISYIHAEGYPAAEMKHGPIALIDENMPAVVIALKDSIYDKVMSNIREIKARRGHIIAIATKGDRDIKDTLKDIIYIPDAMECLTPILSVIPLQLIAYEIAVLRELDVDKPRNLAKSVTVE